MQPRHRFFLSWFLAWLLVMFIWIVIDVYKDYNLVWEDLTCEYRYVGWEYKWTVLAQDGDYIYLSWTSEVRLDCTIVEEEVTEDTPLCWTYIPFNWPIDMSNLNCYKWDEDIKWKLKAFREQEDDAKIEEERYTACNINADSILSIIINDWWCKEYSVCKSRIKDYIWDVCPRGLH